MAPELLGGFRCELPVGNAPQFRPFAAVTMPVSNLRYAVPDRDQSSFSQSYSLDISGSRCFVEHAQLRDYDDLERRLKQGEIALGIEIPPGFGRDLLAGRQVTIGAWFDGAMPQRAETVQGYLQGLHAHWLAEKTRRQTGSSPTGNFFGREPLPLQFPRCRACRRWRPR